jgi:hypothetical protein
MKNTKTKQWHGKLPEIAEMQRSIGDSPLPMLELGSLAFTRHYIVDATPAGIAFLKALK